MLPVLPPFICSGGSIADDVQLGGGEQRHGPFAGGSGEQRHGLVREGEQPPGPVSDGELQHGPLSGGERGNCVNSESDYKVDVECDRSNFYGVNYIILFDIGIEGKDSMNPDEEDWGGRT